MDAEQNPSCKWHFEMSDGYDAIWKTECGLEFDRMTPGEQPRKHLNFEFCPFCSGYIIDETQDC